MPFIIALAVICLTSIITDYLHKQSKLKNKMIKDQIELERLKQENFLLETKKMKLELEKMEKENSLK